MELMISEMNKIFSGVKYILLSDTVFWKFTFFCWKPVFVDNSLLFFLGSYKGCIVLVSFFFNFFWMRPMYLILIKMIKAYVNYTLFITTYCSQKVQIFKNRPHPGNIPLLFLYSFYSNPPPPPYKFDSHTPLIT